MIYIFEDEKKSLSGLTSLYLNFKYNQDIVNIIKSSGTYAFHKDTCNWEVPITSLSYLLDNLCYYDDIDLYVINNDENRQAETLNCEHKVNLYSYQKDGVEYFLNHNKGLLLDSPGLGKTAQMICLAEELQAKGEIDHCLVICGIASLRDNWRKEIAKHSTLSCTIIGERINRNNNRVWEKISKRAEQLKNHIDEFFVILNEESLRYEEVVDAILHSENKFDMIVVDEVHKCNGWSTHQSKGLLSLQAKHQIGMTGTLLMNRPTDAYTPLAWIGVEPKKGITKFKNTYCVFDTKIKGRIVGFKNLDILKDEIDSCSLRRTKDLLDLPSKNIINEYLTMEDAQSNFYDTIKNSVKEEYKQLAIESVDKVKLNTTNLLALTTRLRQASTCPSVLTTQNIVSCKLERVLDLVDEIVSQGDKVVIMSTFKEPVYKLEEILTQYKPLIGTGDMHDIDVSNNIDMFQKDDIHKVFIGTISKMGTGFTLTRASYMIFVDLPWTSALYEQACDRIHRIGTDKPVFIYNLICSNTIDEITLDAVTTKKALSDYIIDDKLDDNILYKLQKYLQDL